MTVTADSRKEARGRIHAILGAFAPYNGTRVFLRRRRAPHALLRLRQRRLGRRAFLLGVDELAALAHLPGQDAIPGVVMAGAREIAPPPGLPATGKPLGRGSTGRQINLAVADARQHIHVLGPTGVGKSTLIARLVLADFDAGRGAVVIDPKGDLIEDILARIPAGREHDVDLLDPLDEAPPGLNVLDSPDRDLGATSSSASSAACSSATGAPAPTTSSAPPFSPSAPPRRQAPSPTCRGCSPTTTGNQASPNRSMIPCSARSGSGTANSQSPCARRPPGRC